MLTANRIVTIVVLIAAIFLATPPAQAADALATDVAQLLDTSLTDLATKGSDTDTAFYDAGMWHYKNFENGYAQQGGPATAAAVLYEWRRKHPAGTDQAAKDRQAWLLKVAVETYDTNIAQHVAADGSFDKPERPDTYFFAVELATAYIVLGDDLDKAHRASWREALEKMIAYLQKTKNLPGGEYTDWIKPEDRNGWYTNGNIELGEAELLYDMFKITGEAKYKTLFETQWANTLKPTAQRFSGFGLVVTKEPTKADGSDGAGYLAESGGKGPGFDGDYAQFQVTLAARLYAMSRDARVLRLLNLLINQTLPLVDQTTWIYDATNGSRHSLKFPYSTCGLAVATWLGGRTDLAPPLSGQFAKATRPTYAGNAKQSWGSPGLYRGYGCDVAVWLQAAMAAE